MAAEPQVTPLLGAIPTPARLTVLVPIGAEPAMDNVAERGATAVGLKRIVTMQEPPPATGAAVQVSLVTEKSAAFGPLIECPVTVTAWDPWLVRVTIPAVAVPPKAVSGALI